MNVASTISPASTATSSFMTVTVPSAATCSMRSVPASSIVTERSFERKSPFVMCATWDAESDDQAPIECGFARAKLLTAGGARRSELPSRSTGLTALPLTRS